VQLHSTFFFGSLVTFSISKVLFHGTNYYVMHLQPQT